MNIRGPKFEIGQILIDKKGNVCTVIHFNSYHFEENEYWYDVSYDGEVLIKTESYLDPYQEPPKTIWDLKEGDTYYLIYGCGDVSETKWFDRDYENDYRKISNVFLTKEEAEFEVERRKIETEMLRLGGRRNFKKGERNWYIYSFCDFGNKHSIGYNYDMDNNDGRWKIYFDSIEDCSNAVNLIGEEKINKYLFGVEE